MKALRLLLYIICFLSFGWLFGYFIGPSIVKFAILSYSNGHVVPSRITVSPKFDVEIGRLDYYNHNSDLNPVSLGFSRSLKISWSLSKEEPFLSLVAGPTFFQNIGSFDSITVDTLPAKLADFNELILSAVIKNINFEKYWVIETLRLNGNYIADHAKVSDLSFVAAGLELQENKLVVVEAVNGHLNELDFVAPLEEKNVLLKFNTSNLSSDYLDINSLSSDVTIAQFPDGFKVSLDAHDLSMPRSDLYFQRLLLDGEFSDEARAEKLHVQLVSGILGRHKTKIEGVKAELIRLKNSIYEANIFGNLSEFELGSDTLYVGKLPATKFQADVISDVALGEIRSNLNFEFNDASLSHVSSISSFFARLKDYRNLTACSNWFCGFLEFDFNYTINLGNERINGSINCSMQPCVMEKLARRISTSNTPKIIEILSQMKFLNPLVIAYFYGALNSAKPDGKGHEINF